MKFYNLVSVDGDPWPEESASGRWATRADAEQMEKERNAYRDECISRGGRELRALCEKEQAAKDAVEMAELVKEYSYYTDQAWVDAQAIIERHEGGTGNG